MDPAVKQFELTPENERIALKIISCDSTFVTKWLGRLQPEHFTHDWSKLVFKAIEGLFRSASKASLGGQGLLPPPNLIKQAVLSSLKPTDSIADVFQHIDDIYNTPVEGQIVMKELILEHMRRQDYRKFAVSVGQAVLHQKYDKISTDIRELLIRHSNIEQPKEYTLMSVADRVKAENVTRKPIQSPWRTLNSNHGGGFESATVTVFMGPTGSGKSVVLCNVGAEFMRAGLTVYHFTFELSREMTEARYDVCLTGSTHEQRQNTPEKLDKWIHDRQDPTKTPKTLGKLYVLERPTGTCRMFDVQAAIEETRVITGVMPDAVILDYLTIMTPNEPKSVAMDNDYSKLKVIAEEARAMAMQLKIPVITAVQSNRGSVDKEIIRTNDIADSFAVLHVCDLVISLNQSTSDKQGGRMRLYVTKSRNHRSDYAVVCDVDYTKLMLTENMTMTNHYNTNAEIRKAEEIKSQKTQDPDDILSVCGSMGRTPGQRYAEATEAVIGAPAAIAFVNVTKADTTS